MRVLVTGGAGFIGSHVVKRLVEQGHDVTVLDDLSTGHLDVLNGPLEDGKVRVTRADIRDREVVAQSIRGMEAIVHLAARTSVPLSVEHPAESLDINVNGTTNLLSACANGEVETFVFASSSAVYGDAKELPTPEDYPLDPKSPYASSKMLAEKACAAFRENVGLPAISLRLFNVYGGAVNGDADPGVIGSFVKRFEKGEPPIIYGDGEQTRDFIHVENVAEAVAYTIERPPSEAVCNLGTGESITINKLARKVSDLYGPRGNRPSYAPPRPGDVRHSQADTSREKKLGITPSIRLDEGLQLALSSRKR
ncbi:NAD-dependent epimerase/dehydratase family protein [Candidatus Bathyarchaeota archaeon]|nr:MAG: NAD-dependent epimerase/dehydratase family protein [Candidatus Bathyarchaeota archaeon]